MIIYLNTYTFAEFKMESPTVHLRMVKVTKGNYKSSKENLSKIKNLFRYSKNMSISLLYEQFLRNGRSFDHFPLSEKNFKFLECGSNI